MAIKRISYRYNKKQLKCLKCNKRIERFQIQDNKVFACDKCGQKHYVDIYPQSIAMTVFEQPEIRRRHVPDWTGIKERLRQKVKEEREQREYEG